TYTLNWDFGDGNFSTLKTPIKKYAAIGSYINRIYSNSNYNCKDTMLYPVKVIASPQAQFTINDSTQCIDQQSFVLSDASSYQGNYNRFWYHPTLDANNSSSISIQYPDTSYKTIQLVILADNACADTAVKRVYVAPLPWFTIWHKDSVCLNDTIQLIAQPCTYAYDWSVDQLASGNTCKSTYTAKKVGWHALKVKATSINGCVSSMTNNNAFNVLALPEVKIQDSIGLNEPNLCLAFKDISPGNIINRWWYFSNGQTGNNQKERILSYDSDTISVSLKIEDVNHCVNQSIVHYQYPLNLYAPNMFTPNNDGLNDVFKVYGLLQFKDFSMRIYDRWGGLLFESNDPKTAWTGEYNHLPVPTGSYLYLINYTNSNNSKGELKGTVSLKR
ncbi:MAG: hypothetical protein RLZZ318_275, partial [Bacteroidota bacterium]